MFDRFGARKSRMVRIAAEDIDDRRGWSDNPNAANAQAVLDRACASPSEMVLRDLEASAGNKGA